MATSSPTNAIGMRPPRTSLCGRCGTYLSLHYSASSVYCELCHAKTRVQRRPSVLHVFLKGLMYSLISPPQPLPPSSEDDCLPASYPLPDRMRALLVGIGYTGTKYALKSTTSDTLSMSLLLRQRFGFRSESILVLSEEEKDPYRVPTMKNLRLAMRWLVQGCNTGNAKALVFHFSGHGNDQALCAVDFEAGGVIPEYEIDETIVRPLGPGVQLHAIVDTHNDDTVGLDLPYRCRIHRTGYWQWENHNRQRETPKGTSGGLAISISGCGDSTYNGDTMTYSFIKAVESEPGSTYGALINAIRAEIRREPQLSASEVFDIYRKQFLLGRGLRAHWHPPMEPTVPPAQLS